MKLSDYYGARIISADKKTSGYILAIKARGDRIECFVCADENEKEFIVDAKSVLSFGNEVVFSDRREELYKSQKLKLGKPSYSQNGKFLGFLTDYETEGDKLKYAVIGKKRYAITDVCNGDAVIATEKVKLKSDVYCDGKIMFKRGTEVTPEVLNIAKQRGEYIQTNLKAIE